MPSARQYARTAGALGLLTAIHAVFTWPLQATLALFGGGALLAFVAEAIVIRLGWLKHHIEPRILGVPPYVLAGWVAVSYTAFRLVLLPADGWVAVLGAGALATIYDLLTDHVGVENGFWTYQTTLGGPSYRGVPWWNFVGWFVISTATAALAVPFL